MKTLHTALPFQYDGTWAIIHGKNGEEVAACHSNKADGAFIVRACNSHYDLLAALERILNAHDSGNNGACMGEAVLCQMFAELARAAILKAKG